ncbi:exodeoxyribonuclease VII large subunit [uncultured Finegoldia sp.]|uniref:exodeoxyribonuclease VII large subunit n=1 Tax=uncultured Finegoldia sp. TaxID=328009 RepID=UPI002610EB00|nr:exodeoxyribonuclease VII large subunit [uncultured Finegoldia sp.]
MMQVYSVKEISDYIQNTLKKDPILSNVWVEGEVSNYTKNISGHIYFRLKDEKALISCMIFKTMSLAKTINIKDGDKVKLRGSITTYQGSSTYQLLVKECEQSGTGDLFKKYLELKSKLESEGYFDESKKKKITKYPKSIGVITSSTGAAVNDICRTIKRRFPICDIVIYHCIVQGEKSAESIIKGIEYMDELNLDTLIVGRGGGSFEDLNSYNDEDLLLKIFNAKTPIISAVGHENDFMLSDFVADLRASTPTAAAEMATCDIDELDVFLKECYFKINRIIQNRFEDEKEELEYYKKQLDFLGPQNIIKEHLKNLLILKNDLIKSYNKNLKDKYNEEINLLHKLNLLKPDKLLLFEINKINDIRLNLIKNVISNIEYKKIKLQTYENNLAHLNPGTILEKGYAKILKNNDSISSVNDVDKNDAITLIMKDGKVETIVRSKEKFSE